MSEGLILGAVVVGYSEMNEADQAATIDMAAAALKAQEKSDKALHHKDVAQMIKQDLDSHRGGTWNVIVGRSFGSFVSHETKQIISFNIGNIAFLIWKHG